jgi:hypothetical protein
MCARAMKMDEYLLVRNRNFSEGIEKDGNLVRI